MCAQTTSFVQKKRTCLAQCTVLEFDSSNRLINEAFNGSSWWDSAFRRLVCLGSSYSGSPILSCLTAALCPVGQGRTGAQRWGRDGSRQCQILCPLLSCSRGSNGLGVVLPSLLGLSLCKTLVLLPPKVPKVWAESGQEINSSVPTAAATLMDFPLWQGDSLTAPVLVCFVNRKFVI